MISPAASRSREPERMTTRAEADGHVYPARHWVSSPARAHLGAFENASGGAAIG